MPACIVAVGSHCCVAVWCHVQCLLHFTTISDTHSLCACRHCGHLCTVCCRYMTHPAPRASLGYCCDTQLLRCAWHVPAPMPPRLGACRWSGSPSAACCRRVALPVTHSLRGSLQGRLRSAPAGVPQRACRYITINPATTGVSVAEGAAAPCAQPATARPGSARDWSLAPASAPPLTVMKGTTVAREQARQALRWDPGVKAF